MFIFTGVCVMTLPLLLWLQSVKNNDFSSSLVPDNSEAEIIFTGLHRNIYNTFNEKNEILAYDRLAKSVDDPFLEKVYKEIYHYFIRKEGGGPSIEIVEVKLRTFKKLNSQGTNKGTGIQFKVKATWDVLSIVTHQKHWHPRTNNFKAIYTLGLIEGEWKIINDEILWQRRIPFDLASFKS